MAQRLDYLKETPSQTAGPYVHIGLAPKAAGFDIYAQAAGETIAGPTVSGERITIKGQVLDGMGAAVKDVLMEIWQADGKGVYRGAGAVEDGFNGWGRVVPNFEDGQWSFDTIKPGAVTNDDGTIMAPHLNLWLVARGINIGLNTRLYFADEAVANAADPVLAIIAPAERQKTLMAVKQDSHYRFDICLQGENETVFFDV